MRVQEPISEESLCIGIVGMGGFAARHHETVINLELKGQQRLIATCDPHLENFVTEIEEWSFKKRGVSIYSGLHAMLDAHGKELDMVIVPTPIHLHASMHAELVNLGIAVYLEKPPTLDYEELNQMLDTEARASKLTAVAFNFILEPPRIELKQRMLAGEFGRLLCVSLKSVIPREDAYFQRNDWAGRLLFEGSLILDSCFGNAMAHIVHNALFWAGKEGLFDWAMPKQACAQLYRVHKIQGADTFFVESCTIQGVEIRIAMTHARGTQIGTMETVECEQATIYFSSGSSIEVHWKDDRIETIPFAGYDGITVNQLNYCDYLRGLVERPATTLEDSVPFVVLNDLAYISSGQITNVPNEFLQRIDSPERNTCFLEVCELNETIDAFLLNRLWPSAKWGEGAALETVRLKDLHRLRTTIHTMERLGSGRA